MGKHIEKIMMHEGWMQEIAPLLLHVILQLASWSLVLYETSGIILTNVKYVADDHIYFHTLALDMKVQIIVVAMVMLLFQIGMTCWSYRHHLNWGNILIPVFTLVHMGLLLQLAFGSGFVKHALMLVAGFLLMILFTLVSSTEPGSNGIIITLLLIGMLGILNIFFGIELNNSTAWVYIPFIGLTIQPGEFFKVLDIILISLAFEQFHMSKKIRVLFISCFIFEAFVLYKVNDTGNLIILLLLGLFCSLSLSVWKTFVTGSFSLVLGGIAASAYILKSGRSISEFMPGIQKRFAIINTILLDPEAEGNFRRLMLAVIRGGIRGTGLSNAEYTYMMNTPAANSDYAILSIAGLFGFAGVIVIVVSLAALVLNSNSAKTSLSVSQYISGKLCGIVLILHAGVNIMAATNIGPLTGTTLPFVSAGGSAILADSMLIGILLGNSYARQKRAQNARLIHKVTDPFVGRAALVGTTFSGLSKAAGQKLVEAVTLEDDEYEEDEIPTYEGD